ncbi:ornithine decarboxylase-like [Panulirus ornatus]|uniref:ornithine decarboxylase-like n=1 Tax=Panulirus ornatus TaxID=150431 RepID=UPI003A84D13C
MSQQHEERILDGPSSVMEVVRDIIAEPGRDEAFLVCDVDDIIKKVDFWRKLMPRVDPFYAVKCNNHPKVLQALSALGTGFDCASKVMNDWDKLSDETVDADVIQKFQELYVVKLLAKGPDPPCTVHVSRHKIFFRLVIRIRSDALISKASFGSKFGVEMKDTRLMLKTASILGLNMVGVSFHVGSGCGEPMAFHRAIASARQVFDEAKSEGYKMQLLDIGGGFPGNDDVLMEKCAQVINTALEMYFPDDGLVKVIAEPGRYVVASAFTLASKITSKREVLDSCGQLSSIMYYTNDGLYSSFGFIYIEDEPTPPVIIKATGVTSRKVASTVWGQSCSNVDRIIAEIQLPILNIGDWLVWFDLGAYSVSLATTFNGFPIPEVYVKPSNRASERLKESINPCKSIQSANEDDVNALELKKVNIS